MNEPVRQSLKQVNSDTWLIGGLLLRRSGCYSNIATWNDDCDNSSYTLTDAPTPRPLATSLPRNNPFIKLVYDAGDTSAVWAVGSNAFCKVKMIIKGTTPEASTLEFVRNHRSGFEIPKVLHYVEHNGRSYLFLRRVPGRTLADAWPSLNKHWRQYYVNAVVNICKDLADLKGHKLSGVDGKNIPEQYLIKSGAADDYSPANLQEGCKAMAMDCSSFVFYHADLGPGNIIVENDPVLGTIGIIDWETAGYLPRGWVRTKFRICSGMNLPTCATDNPTWWRSEVQKGLEVSGFEDYSMAWQLWWY